jgi:hypothetical protein
VGLNQANERSTEKRHRAAALHDAGARFYRASEWGGSRCYPHGQYSRPTVCLPIPVLSVAEWLLPVIKRRAITYS